MVSRKRSVAFLCHACCVASCPSASTVCQPRVVVGEVHNGIAQILDVIEQARILVGTKAIATLSTGYLNALEYAKDRVQVVDLTRMTDKIAPRVTITRTCVAR